MVGILLLRNLQLFGASGQGRDLQVEESDSVAIVGVSGYNVMEADAWLVAVPKLSLFLMEKLKDRKEEETSQEWEDWRLESEALCTLSVMLCQDICTLRKP